MEQALISDELQAADLPGAWNEKYQQYLGIQPPNDADGVMQDIHEQCVAQAPTINGVVDYGAGADRAGFIKVADAIVAMGV